MLLPVFSGNNCTEDDECVLQGLTTINKSSDHSRPEQGFRTGIPELAGGTQN